MNKDLAVVSLVVVACLAITGCHPRTSAGYDMQSSKGKYKDCLKAYPNDDSKCEGLRKIYEVDKGAMEAIGGNKTNVKIEQ